MEKKTRKSSMRMNDVPVTKLDWILTNTGQTYFNFSYMK